MAGQNNQFTFDADLDLTDGEQGIIASEDFTIIDLGAGFVQGNIVVDVASVEVATGNEIYTLSLEGSNVAAMSSGSVCLAKKVFGNLVVPMDAALSAAGRYVFPFRNEENGTIYRYVRLSALVAGTIDTTGLVAAAFLAKI